MKAVTLTPLLAGIGYALPQAARSCYTTTEQAIEPTSTATYLSTYVTSITATTPKDQGTFTEFTRVYSTQTLETITETENDCAVYVPLRLHAEIKANVPFPSTAQPTSTIYTTHDEGNTARSPSIYARQDDEAECTVTVTSTTTYGETYTFVPAGETSTYTAYTAYTHADATSTESGFTTYAIATALTTAPCDSPSTTTQDVRCAPSALISAAGASESSTQYGLSWAQLTSPGATYSTNTTDASSCCQLCAEADKCAASSWDIRTGGCSLEFPVDWRTGELNCGTGLQAYYGAGPAHPMEPGTGLFVAELCGDVVFANAKPDDGT
jgi:hypothetical protein